MSSKKRAKISAENCMTQVSRRQLLRVPLTGRCKAQLDLAVDAHRSRAGNREAPRVRNERPKIGRRALTGYWDSLMPSAAFRPEDRRGSVNSPVAFSRVSITGQAKILCELSHIELINVRGVGFPLENLSEHNGKQERLPPLWLSGYRGSQRFGASRHRKVAGSR
jgi:hypothetical protein